MKPCQLHVFVTSLLALGICLSVADLAFGCTRPDRLGLGFVIDDSGSMRSNDPGYLRVDAVDVAFDQAPDGTVVAGSGFNDSATTLIPTTELTSSNRSGLLDDMRSKLFPYGNTDYDAAFAEGKGRLDAVSADRKALIFLSDGEPSWEYDADLELARVGIPVFAVGFAEAPPEELQNIAARSSGGAAFAIQTVSQARAIFARIVAGLQCDVSLYSGDLSLAAGERREIPFTVSEGQRFRVLSTWSDGEVVVTLKRPDGTVFTTTTPRAGENTRAGDADVTFTSDNPIPGTWLVIVHSTTQATDPTVDVWQNRDEALALAQKYRPYLFFDNSEKWRPLDVDAFMQEERMNICSSENSGCKSLSSGTGSLFSPELLSADPFASSSAVLDQQDGDRNDWQRHRSDRADCNQAVAGQTRFDCDGAASNVIYYQLTSGGGYQFINYWFFYRFNSSPFGGLADALPFIKNMHESDWEGVTVALSPNQDRPFDYVGFDAHGKLWRYLHELALCNGNSKRRCRSTEDRVNAYVADSTHATYSFPCSRKAGVSCTQTGSYVPEGGYDGRFAWARNNVGHGLQRLPAPGERSWIDWSGNWNEDERPRIASPADPAGANYRRYADPGAHTYCHWDGGCKKARSSSGSNVCASWFSPQISALACDEATLKQAEERAELGGQGSFELQVPGAYEASAPGMAQALGRPLRVGDRATVTGTAPATTELRLRLARRNKLTSVLFRDIGLEHGGKASVRVTFTRGKLSAVLRRPDGRQLKPAATARQALKRVKRPKIVSAVRKGSHVFVRVRASSKRVVLYSLGTRRGSPLGTKYIRLPKRAKLIRLTASTRVRYVKALAVSAEGVTSQAVTKKIRRGHHGQ